MHPASSELAERREEGQGAQKVRTEKAPPLPMVDELGEMNLDKYMDPQDEIIFKRYIAGQLPGI